MKENWEKLVAVLVNTVELYKAILQLSREKREILVAAKPQDLDSVTKQEELLILQAGRLEAFRGALLNEIAALHGIAPQDLTLNKIRGLAEPAVAERLEQISADFDQIMAELAPVNALNAELIQRALRFINYNLNLITKSTTSPTYASQGGPGEDVQGRKLVDQKI